MKNQKPPNLPVSRTYWRDAKVSGNENNYSSSYRQPPQPDSLQLQVRVLLRRLRLGEALAYPAVRIARDHSPDRLFASTQWGRGAKGHVCWRRAPALADRNRRHRLRPHPGASHLVGHKWIPADGGKNPPARHGPGLADNQYRFARCRHEPPYRSSGPRNHVKRRRLPRQDPEGAGVRHPGEAQYRRRLT